MKRLDLKISALIENAYEEAEKYSEAVSVAYLCSFIPPEIVEAAGCIPYRLIRKSSNLANPKRSRYVREDACTFCKECLSNFPIDDMIPEVIVAATPCDQMRRTLELFHREHGVNVIQLNLPRTAGKEGNVRYFVGELERLGDQLSKLSGKTNWRDDLEAKSRERLTLNTRLKSIEERRSANPPEISGLTATHLILSAWELPSDTMASLLTEVEKFLNAEQFEDSSYEDNAPARIMLIGSILSPEDLRYIDYVESHNALVVSDAFCTGFSHLADAHPNDKDDLLYRISSQFLNEAKCPSIRPNDKLYEFISEQTSSRRIDAIIQLSLKYCHPWSFEATRLRDTFNLPFLEIDNDGSPSYEAQWKTRISAFLESLSLRKVNGVKV